MNKKFFHLSLFVIISGLGLLQLFMVSSVRAQCAPSTNALANGEVCRLENPLGVGQKGTTEVTGLINIVIKAALGIIGGLTLLMFVWGGFQWLTSAGNPEKVSAGSQTMIWAVIGVVLVLASYILLSTFLEYLSGKA